MVKKKDKRIPKTPECLNCHQKIGDQNFCPNCGQQNANKQASLRDFLHDALGDFLTFDHKFFRSFKPLLFKPGFLTKEYNQGRRVNYILPLRMYIFISLVFFFVFTLKGFTDNSIPEIDDPDIYDITSHLFKSKDVDSLKIYKLNNAIHKKYNKIKINKEAKISNDFFKEEYQSNDSLRNETAYFFYRNFEIEADENFEPSKRDSSLYFKRISKSNLNMSHDKALSIYNRLTKNFDIDINRNPVKKSQSSFFRPSLLNAYSDSNTADYVYRELILNYSFNNVNQDMNFGLNEIDSTESSLIYRFVKMFEDKAKRIQTVDNAESLFWKEFIDQLPKVIFFLLPIFALIVKLVYVRRKIFYVNHLIFSLHVHSIIFIYLLIIILLEAQYLLFLLIPALWFHLFFSIRNVYGQSKFLSFIKLNMIFFIYLFFLVLGFAVTSAISFFQI